MSTVDACSDRTAVAIEVCTSVADTDVVGTALLAGLPELDFAAEVRGERLPPLEDTVLVGAARSAEDPRSVDESDAEVRGERLPPLEDTVLVGAARSAEDPGSVDEPDDDVDALDPDEGFDPPPESVAAPLS